MALPKVAEPAQIVALDAEVTRLERAYGIGEGSTWLAPNIESARGVMQTYAIAKSSPRVVAVIGSTEDMAADLNAERSMTVACHNGQYFKQEHTAEDFSARRAYI